MMSCHPRVATKYLWCDYDRHNLCQSMALYNFTREVNTGKYARVIVKKCGVVTSMKKRCSSLKVGFSIAHVIV